MNEELDFVKFSQEELDAFALKGIEAIISEGTLPLWLLSMAKSMSAMEIRLKKLEGKESN